MYLAFIKDNITGKVHKANFNFEPMPEIFSKFNFTVLYVEFKPIGE